MTTSSISPADAAPARARAPRFSLDTWAVAAAVLFIVLVVAGIFPRVPW
jgi:hypothetical protein